MAWRNYGYRRNSWNRGGRYYGRNRRNYYSSSRRASGNMRAAKQQADQSTFTINIPSVIYASLKTNSTAEITGEEDPKTMSGIYAMNIFDQLRKSSFFRSYASMYDEFKIDRIKVKLLPTEFTYTATTGDNSRYKNVTVYTAWDRTGLSGNQLKINLDKFNSGSSNQLGTSGDAGGIYTTIGTDITTYSSAESRIVNPGTNTSIVRWLNPKTMDEKAQWISTSNLKEWYKFYDENLGRYYGIPIIPQGGATTVVDGDFEIQDLIEATTTIEEQATTTVSERAFIGRINAANSNNPCYLLEDPAIKFKPTLLVGVYPPVKADQSNICKFNVESEIVCTFRGLRKAAVVAA